MSQTHQTRAAQAQGAGRALTSGKGRWIANWEPEDPGFWDGPARRIARRNLIWSVAAEHLGFTVWTLWSVVTVHLSGRGFSADQLFWLVALPNLVGAVLRVPYTFAPARFGGRNWTVVSALLLTIPAVLLAVAVHNPHTPYWAFLLIAATAGVGGGNFASSMANITHFYPRAKQGGALGINAAGGNIGVSSVQLILPWVISALGLAAAGLVWVPLVLAAALAAWFGMDNLRDARSSVPDQLRVARNGQTWLVSLLYIGTFGSFIGYSTALPLLIKVSFPELGLVQYTFVGALVGSLVRPLGGMASDRWGGARVTIWAFATMPVGAAGVVYALREHNYPLFLASFLLLFVLAGVGNGSTYRMVPAIFAARAHRMLGAEHPDAAAQGRRDSAAAIGVISAVGALGGFFINRGLGTSIAHTGNADAAMTVFAVCYALCAALTWYCYGRKGRTYTDV
ncbi:MFS transporter [Kitasatospora sp. NPDC002227]|uniref:MFS transporter n=1 Tax=Kitasatospora sp. NPDC002227 TaxID=3154773 RepID=UPI00331A060C